MNITLDDVIAVVGEYKRKRQNEYEFQCPYCAETGGDTHCDNLKFNAQKHVLYCFANPEHSQKLFKKIIKIKQETSCDYYEKAYLFKHEVDKELTIEQKKELFAYTFWFNQELLQSDFLLDYLFQTRGITEATVKEVFLGYDNETDYWVIPTIEYNTDITQKNVVTGFEYRPINFSKQGIRRSTGTPNTLAMINEYTINRECLAIVEGYFDGYALFQYLTEIEQINKYHIVTCSNGVQSLLKQVDIIDFLKYKEIFLFIDNDEVSNPVAIKILEKYPFMKRITLNCGCKDFNEHYLKCIRHKI